MQLSDVAGVGTGTTPLIVDASAVTLTGGVSIVGNNGADTLIGSAYNDTIEGGGGADTIDGGGGVNTATYSGSSAGVTVNLSTNVNTAATRRAITCRTSETSLAPASTTC